jgi:hypothetical protein
MTRRNYQPFAIAFLTLLALLLGAGASFAQNAANSSQPAKEAGQAPGFLLYERFEGSSSADGQIMDLNTSTGYNFNRFFGVDVGVPVYFVRTSSTISKTNPSGLSGNGVGDVSMGGRLTFNNPLVNFGSTFSGTAPTGDTGKGHSTGHWTYDWTNHFDRDIGRLTPFADVGLGNSIADTKFFKRPYTSYGHLAHFEAGTDFGLWRSLRFSASLYDVQAWGGQQVFSRVVRKRTSSGGSTSRRQFETQSFVVGGAELVRDNGYNLGVNFSPTRFMDLSVGFNHSVHLRLDTVSFGIGFNIGSLIPSKRLP